MLSSLAVILAGILWGTMGLFVRYLTAVGFSLMQIAFMRVSITMVVIGLYIAIRDREAFRVKLRDLWCFFGTGILSILFFSYCYFTTITLTSLSIAAILLYTAPIFVMLMSVLFFKEKLTVKKLLALAMAFCGCFLVSGAGGELSAAGLLFGLGAGFGYALYSIFARFAALRGYKPLTITFYTFLFATAGCLPLTDVVGLTGIITADTSLLPIIILLGVVSCVLPYSLYTWGLVRLETSRASIMASVEPVAATIIGAAVYHETLSVTGLCGIVLVICAILQLTIDKKHEDR